MSGNDPRGIDPAQAESDETDVAQEQGSSTPLVDAEEQDGEERTGDREADQRALDAMPADDGTSEDQVVSRQPDSVDRQD